MVRNFVFFLFILVFLLACTNNGQKKSSSKPNIVLINVDDLGWKDLAFMGSTYYETPYLDRLAQEGMVFMNAYAAAANCAPSRACMLSGRNTPWHGVYTVSPSERGSPKTRKLIPVKNTAHLQDSVHTLPKMLKSAGYVTGSFGKWHVGEDPTTQGIDVNVGGSHRGNPGKNGYFSPYNIDFIEDGPDGEYLTDRLTDEAIKFVEKNKDTAFFLYLPFYTVHTPIMGKKSLVEKFKSKKGIDGQNRPDYAAMVFSMDENVGRLLSTLRREGLDEQTIVIFTSDNGGIRDISAQDPLRAGKGSYYEGGIRVPLVIKWPGHIKPASSSQVRVSNLDIYPTLQKIVNTSRKAAQLDGMDLSPILQERKPFERDLFFHFPIYLQAYSQLNDNGRDPLFRTRPGSVIISGDWKLHEYFEDGGLELYNLNDDLGETKNLAEALPEKAMELREKLISWRTENKAPVPMDKNPNYDEGFETEQLKKVGR